MQEHYFVELTGQVRNGIEQLIRGYERQFNIVFVKGFGSGQHKVVIAARIGHAGVSIFEV